MKKHYFSLFFCLILLLPHCSLAQAVRVTDIFSGRGNSRPQQITEYNGALYFFALDSVEGRWYKGLWKYDGTTTSLVADDITNFDRRNIRLTEEMGVYNGFLYFTADDGVHGHELWKSDGHSAWMVVDLIPGPGGSYLSHFTEYNGGLYFYNSYLGPHNGIWDSRGTSFGLWELRGTSLRKIEHVNSSLGITPGQETFVYNNELFFAAEDRNRDIELWKYDGTTVSLVADINPGFTVELPHRSSPRHFVEYNGILYFTAYTNNRGRELWKYDGTSVSLAAEHKSGVLSGMSEHLNPHYTIVDGVLCYKGAENESPVGPGTDGANDRDLYTFDGTTATRVSSMISLRIPNDPFFERNRMIEYGGDLYYISGIQLIRANLEGGRPIGTDVIIPRGFPINDLIVFDEALYFIEDRDLWKYDGTSATRIINHISLEDRFTELLTLYNDALYFGAYEPTHGRELWKYTPTYAHFIEGVDLGSLRWYPRAYTQDFWDQVQIDWLLAEPEEEEAEHPSWHMQMAVPGQLPSWEYSANDPGTIPIPPLEPQLYSLTLRSEQQEQPLIRLSEHLVPSGVNDLKFDLLFSKNRIALKVGTLEGTPVPLRLSLTNAEGETVWQTELKAPYEGELDVDGVGTTLHVTLAEEGYNYRTEEPTKVAPQSTGLSHEIPLGQSSIQVYPNPVVNHTLQLEVFSPEASKAKVEVLNLMGQQVLQRELSTQAGQQRLTMDMQGVPRGAYILKVQQGQQQTTTRLLVPE